MARSSSNEQSLNRPRLHSDANFFQVANSVRRPEQFRRMAAASRAAGKHIPEQEPPPPSPDDDDAFTAALRLVGRHNEAARCRMWLAQTLNSSCFLLVLDLVTIVGLVNFVLFNCTSGKALYEPSYDGDGQEGDFNIKLFIPRSDKYYKDAHPYQKFRLSDNDAYANGFSVICRSVGVKSCG